MKRKAKAQWRGPGADGAGVLHTTSGVLDGTPYSAYTRFKSEDGLAGTNPEELIAAAHAGCFAMALSFRLSAAGFTADTLDVDATLTMENDGGWSIKSIHLDLKGSVPGVDAEQFAELAQAAKANCPVSKALNCEITLSAELV
jgi:osmotically inducible protein OsmC